MRASRDLSAVKVRIRPFEIGSGTPEDGGGRLDGGLSLSNAFTTDLDDPGLNALVSLTIEARSGRLVASSIVVAERGGGPPITGAALRAVPVESYVDLVRKAARTAFGLLTADSPALVPTPAGTAEVSQGPPSDDQWDHFAASQRGAPTEDLLPAVARIYREALASPDPRVRNSPTAQVARQLHYHRGHAARLVTRARKEGLLRAARPGRAGEQPQPKRKRSARR